MEIGHALPPSLGPVAAAWGESPAADVAVEADAGMLGHEPGVRVDHGVEAAGMQTVARTPQQPDEPRPVDQTHADTPLAAVEFALPADLTVPVALVGLQVEAAAGWPLPPHTFDPLSRTSQRPVDEDDARRQAETADEPEIDEDTDDDTEHVEAEEVADETPVPDEPWCEALSLALRRALAARVTPQALLAAAEQWQRSRCVVLACPQGIDPSGPAWAFVLWPRLRHAAASTGAQRIAPALSLYGLRVDARLQWSSPPRPGQWCYVRVVKEHHPRTGRQLVAVDGSTDSKSDALPCEVQLGPVLARTLRRCDVCVRIPAAQRFWNALGAQWSVHVVVCALPLVDADAATLEAATC
jgi:hypothetical protein